MARHTAKSHKIRKVEILVIQILIDKNMSKTQLIKAAQISTNAMARLGKNEDVRVEVLVKICGVLGCTVDDIMEIIPEDINGGNDNG